MNYWALNEVPDNRFQNIIVIPAISEHENIKKLIKSISCCDKKYFDETLLLLVINSTDTAPEIVKQDNQQTIEYLQNQHSKEIKIVFVDASTGKNAMPEKEGGVGLARKIGMDIALTLFDYKSSRKKILICLDADCTVADNYITQIVDEFNNRNLSAAYVNYEHLLPENEIEKAAIICYEIFLRYYVLGLMYANSPYAFHTIGSTMMCDYESYIKIGGMNKQKAAEDFYFLEKLAKHTKVYQIKNTTVYPSSRGSWRVPFGTGQRVNRFLAKSQNEYLLYNPNSFCILKKWIELFYSNKILVGKDYSKKAEEIHPDLKEFLAINSFEKQWTKILEGSKTEIQVQKQKLLWFDGFRTLKLIHFLRDNSFPLVNMFDALDKLFKLTNVEQPFERTESNPPLSLQIEYLQLLRTLT
jgi:hypothetical protein